MRHLDPDLEPIVERAGPLPLRLQQPGYRGLARIVVSQQVSVASATAIWERIDRALPDLDAESLAAASDDLLRTCGLSRPKIRTLRAVADAVVSDGLDLAALAESDPQEARSALVALHGIGPWTADIYLLFCSGHPDIFPVGDIALQQAVCDAFAMGERPQQKALALHAERWAPWRGVAARLFWAYYRACRSGRESLPV